MTPRPGPALRPPKEDATHPSSGNATPVAGNGGQDGAGGEGALTYMGPMYTLPTHTGPDSEADAITVRQFLNTLAEVALAVATRTTVKQ